VCVFFYFAAETCVDLFNLPTNLTFKVAQFAYLAYYYYYLFRLAPSYCTVSCLHLYSFEVVIIPVLLTTKPY